LWQAETLLLILLTCNSSNDASPQLTTTAALQPLQLARGFKPFMRMQEKVGIRSHHCSVIATDIKQKVDEEVADAEGPSTSCKSGHVTLCVEGNISAGKSTFLNWVAQGHPELDGMLEVPGM